MQIGVESYKAVDNKRVFVVDSDDVTSAALQFMLHDENETHELPTIEAMLAKSVDWKPDLLILGLSIVKQRGEDLIASLKAQIPGLAIMLVSDAADLPFALGCLKAGANDIVAKPLTIESVRGKVDKLLGR